MKALARFAAAPALALALLGAPGPLLAQEQAPADDAAEHDALAGMMGALGGMFAAEPLTAEEQARLPAATALVDRIVPAGTMGELMGNMFDGVLGPIMAMDQADARGPLAKLLGLESYALGGLDEADAAKAIAMLDPAWQTRKAREAEALPAAMNTMMAAMEPTIKQAMSELYAVYFDEAELADIDAFFATPSGAAYARKSFTMSADPRMAGAMMQAMPAMFAGMGQMQAQMEAATADLPAPRGWGDLDAGEQKALAALIGMTREDIAASIAAAEGE